jgi:tyrosine-protein kinase Etk/Wzc
MMNQQESVEQAFYKGGGKDPVDVKSLGRRILRNIQYVIIGLVIGMGSAYVYTKLLIPQYQAESIMLMRDDQGKGGSLEIMMTGLGYYNPRLRYENELLIMKSRALTQRALGKLDFEVSYYNSGGFKALEIYGEESPYIFEYDIEHNQIIESDFHFIKENDNTFTFYRKEAGRGYNFAKEELKTGPPEDWKDMHSGIVIGEWVESPYYRFRLLPNPNHRGKVVNHLIVRLTGLEALEAKYIRALQVEPTQKESSGITLRVVGENSLKNRVYLNTFMHSYIEYNLEEKNAQANRTITFIDEQLSNIEDSLSAARTVLQDFRSSKQVINLDAETQSALNKLFELESELAALSMRESYYDYLKDRLTKRDSMGDLASPLVAGIDNSSLVSLVSELSSLYLEIQKKKMTMTQDNPRLPVIYEQIEIYQNLLIDNLRALRETEQIKKKELVSQKYALQNQIKGIPKTEFDLMAIQRKFTLNENLYNFLLQKRAEVGISKSGVEADMLIVEEAHSLSTPNYPKPRLNLIIGALLGFVIPIGFITLKEVLDNKIHHPGQLKNFTKIPLLATIGHYTHEDNIPARKRPNSNISEAFRGLRSNLRFIVGERPEGKNRIILITSSISGEGKTFIAHNLAISLAQAGNKVIMVGADLRKPKIYMDFERTEAGLSNYLTGLNPIEECIFTTEVENLSVMPSGIIPPFPAELLQGEIFDGLLKTLSDKYDYVVIDSAPMLLVSDTLEIVNKAGLVLYTVRSNYTEQSMLNMIQDMTEKDKLSRIGIVLNNLQQKKSIFGYGYGYGYGYGGYGEEDEKP